MEQGPTEKAIIQAAARDRTPLPARIQNKPDVWLGLEIYYQAFMDLTSCRGHGYGTEGPISWLTIAEYADRLEFDDDQRSDLFYFVQKLDAVYLDFKTKKLQAATKTPVGAKKAKR